MCVIAAVKLPRDPHTGKSLPDAKWRLAKIRDRAYKADFAVKRNSTNDGDTSQLFLVDQHTDWTEGVSIGLEGKFLGIVNSSLINEVDIDDGIEYEHGGNAIHGLTIRKALKQDKIEDAVKIIVDNRIEGNTFITDGETLAIIEIYIPEKIKEKYIPIAAEKNKNLLSLISPDEYEVKYKFITDEEELILRTNHGVMLPEAGFQKKDGENYKSSVNRKKYAKEAIIKRVFHPIDLLVELSKLGRDEIDKNPYYRPIRLRGLAINKDNLEKEIFSTAVVQLDPSGTIFLRPIECDVDDISINKLADKKRRTNLVVLPAHIPLFESFKNFIKF